MSDGRDREEEFPSQEFGLIRSISTTFDKLSPFLRCCMMRTQKDNTL